MCALQCADMHSMLHVRDVTCAVQVLGGGFRVVELGERMYVASVPKELDRDSNTVMQAAQVGLHWPAS